MKLLRTWAKGLGLKFESVDLAACMMYDLAQIFNRELVRERDSGQNGGQPATGSA